MGNSDLTFKIVADSSADLLEFEGVDFASTPLKIITAEKEYVDDAKLNVAQMVEDLLHYSGKSSTSCPSVGEWIEAFGDADRVFAITITGTLSGSYNAACSARDAYLEAHPDRKVFVVNSLSTGPEMKLIMEKIRESIAAGKSYEEICDIVNEYRKHTGLLFVLESMKNLANNGRVSPIVAKAAGLLGIRVVGRASDRGDLEQLDKCRGEKKALETIVRRLKSLGCNGGKIRIAHCLNEGAALKLKDLIAAEFSKVQVEIYKCGGLCSFYAEKGGMLIGYESL